ncbi:hypothetical protein GCM10027020_07190 [Nocardioides salsibiostraticola]
MPLKSLRTSALVAATGLLLAGLAACGDQAAPEGSVSDDALTNFEAVSITGDIGSEPEVEWKGQMSADDLETEVLTEGDGPALAAGDEVVINYFVGNGFSQRTTYTSYSDEPSGQLLTLSDDFSPIFLAALKDQKIGSRVAVVGSAEASFGEGGNPELGVGNQDTVLLVMDLSSGVLEKAEGPKTLAKPWVPGLNQDKGVPANFVFTKTPQPTAKLRVSELITGEGPEVKKGDLIVVNYLGQTYQGAKPFDESYSKQPASFGIGIGAVIKGWDQALVGKTVGSRVILSIPPDLGYGESGNEQAGIKGTDTLFFIIDILGAG